MLPSLDDWLRAKKLRNYLILSRDFNDQRILQSDWTRALSGHTHSRVIVSDLTLPCWLSPCKNSKALGFIPSRDTDDQRIVHSIWTRGTTSRTEIEMPVSDVTFPRWLCPCEKNYAINWPFPKTLMIKNPATCLGKRHNRPHPTISSSFGFCIPLMVIYK